MICGVTGSRSGQPAKLMGKFRHDLGAFAVTVLHVGCRDYEDPWCKTDAQAARVARAAGIPVEFHPPDFERYGSPKAYHVRNSEVVAAVKRDNGTLFSFPGGRGTESTRNKAIKAGVSTISYPVIPEQPQRRPK